MAESRVAKTVGRKASQMAVQRAGSSVAVKVDSKARPRADKRD
jgi:hypothetical protein